MSAPPSVFWTQGETLTPEEHADGCEYIYNIAQSINNIEGTNIIDELLRYKSREGICSQGFVWDIVEKLKSLVR